MSRRSSHRGTSSSRDFLDVIVRPKKVYRTRSSSVGSIYTREKVVVEPNENLRIIKNLMVLSLSISLLYVAYQGTINLQSSLNAEGSLGTYGLSMVYTAMGISCLFLPTLIIRRITAKWTIVFSCICYIPYIAFQLHPTFYTLLPAGALLGAAAAPMWAAQATYLTQIGQVYAILTHREIDAVLVFFFGVFFLCWQNADTVGNFISSMGEYRKDLVD